MLLSKQDFEKIDIYTHEWAGGCSPMDSETYLEEYVHFSDRKKTLYRLLNNQLIYKNPTPIKFKKSKEALEQDFRAFVMNYSHDFFAFETKLKKRLESLEIPFTKEILDILKYSKNNNVENVSLKKEVFLFNERKLRLDWGFTYTTIMSAIIKFFLSLKNKEAAENIRADFKDLRNIISRFYQTSHTEGTLCLSIHPLDYFTMSHNGYNWHTCMNWDRGGYCAGTLEMLSSDYVLVAYLEGKEEWYPTENKAFTWSNKKWRELFIVHEDFISGIKSYPYDNPELRVLALNLIKELAKNNLGWRFGKNEFQSGAMRNTQMRTNLMYNDYYSSHYFCIRTKAKELPRIFNYSGEALCLECGAPIAAGLEGYVACQSCLGLVQCCGCGEWVTSDQWGHWVGDNFYCEDCFIDLPQCYICGHVEEIAIEGATVLKNDKDFVFVDICKHCEEHFGIVKATEEQYKDKLPKELFLNFFAIIYPTKNIDEFLDIFPNAIIFE